MTSFPLRWHLACLAAFVGALLLLPSSAHSQALFDLRHGNGDYPRSLTVVDGRIFFVMEEALWYYEPETGRAGGPFTPATNCGVSPWPPLVRYHDRLFVGTTGVIECAELLYFDLKTERIEVAAEVPGENRGLAPEDFTVYDDRLFFTTDSEMPTGLWVFDAAAGMAQPLAAAERPELSRVDRLLAHGGRLYFTNAQGLYYFDAARDDVVQVGAAQIREPGPLASLGDVLYLAASGPSGGTALWSYRHGDDGLRRVADLPSDPQYLRATAGRLFFDARDGSTGRELWTFAPGGTPALAADVCPGPCDSFPSVPVEHEGRIFFTAGGVDGRMTLWSYDPADGRTQRHGLDGSPQIADRALASHGGRLFFGAFDAAQGRELWSYDPAAGAPRPVADLSEKEAGSSPGFMGSLDEVVFVSAWTGLYDSQVWLFEDGGVRRYADVFGAGAPPISGALVAYQGRLYGRIEHPELGVELGVVDPARGTVAVAADLCEGPCSSYPSNLTPYAGRLFLEADDGVHGGELWAYDATTGRAALAAEVVPGPQAASIDRPVVFDGRLFFAATDAAHDTELWAYDDATRGVRRVADLWPGERSSVPRDLTVLDGRLYFMASDSTGGAIWVYEPGRGRIGPSFGKIDTGDLDLLCSCSADYLTSYAGRLYFVADDGTHGYEPWYYDPRSHDVGMAYDVHPGPASSFMYNPTRFDGRLFFTSLQGGFSLWYYDAAEGRAAPARDLLGMDLDGTFSKYAAGNHFLLGGDDGVHGRELWVFSKYDLHRDEAPGGNLLVSNAPNPFRGRTRLYFTLFETAHVRIDVHDLLGRRVATLVDEVMAPGAHHAAFDAEELAAGLYLARIRTGGRTLVHKMMRVR